MAPPCWAELRFGLEQTHHQDKDRTERFYKIDQLIRARGVVPFETLLDEREVSRATLKRDRQDLRGRLQIPIAYDREAGGYRRTRGTARHTQAVELDGQVIDVARTYLQSIHHGALDDPRVKLRIEDGAAFVADTNQRFDLVLLDLTDPETPAGPL